MNRCSVYSHKCCINSLVHIVGLQRVMNTKEFKQLQCYLSCKCHIKSNVKLYTTTRA